jgi:hypothetical protein
MAAATLQLARNTHVYMKVGDNIWKLPVLDGFSFSQATATQEIALNEMQTGSESSRGRTMFNTALEPAEWSFSTYARPTLDSSTHTAVEEALWAMFFGATGYTPGTGAWNPAAITSNNAGRTSSMVVTSALSNTATLGEFELFFVLGGCSTDAAESTFAKSAGQTIYKMTKCVVNSASVDFDIDGITTINWSGFGATLGQEASLDASSSIKTGLASTSNYLRNRVTSLAIRPNNRFAGDIAVFGESNGAGTTDADDVDQDGDNVDDFATGYDLTITGGTINFENNITFLTPDELCKVNAPIGHVTGNRAIGGNFTCYLNDNDGSPSAAGYKRSAAFFDDLATATNLSQNSFAVTFTIGGTAGLGSIAVKMPTCHIETPTHQIEDIVSLETTFHALPSTMTGKDDVTLTYVGV